MVTPTEELLSQISLKGAAEAVMEGGRCYFRHLDFEDVQDLASQLASLEVRRLAEENEALKRALDGRLRIDEGSELQWSHLELRARLDSLARTVRALLRMRSFQLYCPESLREALTSAVAGLGLEPVSAMPRGPVGSDSNSGAG